MPLEKSRNGPEEQVMKQFRQAAAGYLIRVAELVDAAKAEELVSALSYAQMAMSRKKPDEFREHFTTFKTLNYEIAKERGDMFLSEKANAVLAAGSSWEELNKEE